MAVAAVKEGFILRKMPGMNLVMPTGAKVKEFRGALMLNDTGALIFSELKDGKTVDEAAETLCREYDVTLDKARADIEKTIASLKEAGVVDA